MKLPEFFGLDIGNHSIKVAQVAYKSADKAELIALGHVESSVGVFDLNDQANIDQIAEQIKQIRQSARISTKQVVAALPEGPIFTRLVTLPDVSEKELEEAVFYEAQQYLPVAISDVQLEYIPISTVNLEGKKMLNALLVAAPKKLASQYIQIIEKAGLELIALETETIATARAVTFANQFDSSILVLDFGANGTDIGVIKNKSLIFSQSLGTGSDALTKAIAADFSLDLHQAEEYKRAYGLDETAGGGKIANSISPIMQIIINEINKTINYFRAHLQESTPKKIFVVGDGAKLPGLAAYLGKFLGIECQLLDPVSQLEVSSGIKAEVAQLSTIGFTVAVGLALKTE